MKFVVALLERVCYNVANKTEVGRGMVSVGLNTEISILTFSETSVFIFCVECRK